MALLFYGEKMFATFNVTFVILSYHITTPSIITMETTSNHVNQHQMDAGLHKTITFLLKVPFTS